MSLLELFHLLPDYFTLRLWRSWLFIRAGLIRTLWASEVKQLELCLCVGEQEISVGFIWLSLHNLMRGSQRVSFWQGHKSVWLAADLLLVILEERFVLLFCIARLFAHEERRWTGFVPRNVLLVNSLRWIINTQRTVVLSYILLALQLFPQSGDVRPHLLKLMYSVVIRTFQKLAASHFKHADFLFVLI